VSKMNDAEQTEEEALDWQYEAPPTIYDLVHDNMMLRGMRPPVHLIYRATMRWYHRLSVVGRGNFLDNRPCIITPNHSSHLDALAVFASLPISQVNSVCAVSAKDYFFCHPVAGWLARLVANCIPVDREGDEDTMRGVRLCARRLKKGKSLIIFPEGTRSLTGEIGRFKPGASTLGRGLRIPIIPTYVDGAMESLGKNRVIPKPYKIRVVFGEKVCFWEGDFAGLPHDEAAKYLEDRVRSLKKAHQETVE
jgi:1-acyl-sn-glycerol-3-phosphate acyltransferase